MATLPTVVVAALVVWPAFNATALEDASPQPSAAPPDVPDAPMAARAEGMRDVLYALVYTKYPNN